MSLSRRDTLVAGGPGASLTMAPLYTQKSQSPEPTSNIHILYNTAIKS